MISLFVYPPGDLETEQDDDIDIIYSRASYPLSVAICYIWKYLNSQELIYEWLISLVNQSWVISASISAFILVGSEMVRSEYYWIPLGSFSLQGRIQDFWMEGSGS